MASLSARISTRLLNLPLCSGGGSFNAVPKVYVKRLQYKFTWSQIKQLHSQAAVILPSQFSQSRSNSRWRWLVLAATAGFSQGFLGFSLGKKEEEKGGDPLMRVYREAKEAHMKQDFNKAEIRYHDALKVADELLKLKKITFKTYIYAKTNIYDSLADMALGLGELEKAERLYKETMKGCLQQGLPQDDNAIIELSVKLASIYAMMNKRSEAEQGLLFCIHAQDAKLSADKEGADAVAVSDTVKEANTAIEADGKKLVLDKNNNAEVKEEEEDNEKQKDTEALLGMALETYGRFLMGDRRFTEAVTVLERASGIAEKVLGKEQGQYFILMNDLATAHILLKNFDKAIDILHRLITAATKVQSQQLPVLYCNLGAVYLRSSKLDKAEEACLKGQELSSKGKHTTAFTMSQKCLEKIGKVKNAATA